MRTKAILLLLLTIHAVCGQLNYEGNPLTEDTVYTAEESHFAENTAKARSLRKPETEDSYLLAARIVQAERSKNQNLYPSNDAGVINGAHLSSRNDIVSGWSSSSNSYKTLPNDSLKKSPSSANDAVFETQTTETQYYKNTEAQDRVYPISTDDSDPQLSNPSESALEMFLNSKTPQESRMALDALIGGEKPDQTAVDSSSYHHQPHISDIVLPQQQSVGVEPQLDSQLELQPIGSSDQTYFPGNPQASQGRQSSMVVRSSPPSYGRRSFSVRPSYKIANYRAQSRVGAPPGYRKGPYGSFGGAPEIIYTKPPGYGNSLYERGKNPYEDASAWFPDANYPPPDVNVYHSQLYAQSYDPHYYNYIAKYGKIKPHLYGKFEKKEESFVWELLRSFKKHGMKHVMNPMFLLGLGIPMVTLMLSALVKRSFARSSSGIAGDLHITEEEIEEWTRKLRQALECYTQSASESERMKCAVSD